MNDKTLSTRDLVDSDEQDTEQDEDFDQRAADLSVDHPDVVENYRQGHDLARRTVRGEGDTESLRQALVHYRALFAELVERHDADDREREPDEQEEVRR